LFARQRREQDSMSVWTDSGSEFRPKPSRRSLRSAVLPKRAESIAKAHRRGALARVSASACQKEFALEQALRKAKTPQRPFICDG
jgi:hypothetical protein